MSNSATRATTIERSAHSFVGRYKNCDVEIDREDGCNWYITVRGIDGCYLYNGWWQNSAHLDMNDAITEACTGAMLWPSISKLS